MKDGTRVYVMEVGGRAYYQLQWLDPLTQRKRTKSTNVPWTGLARDRKAAERLAGELEAQLLAGSAAAPSRFGWAEFRERYEKEVVPGLAKRTGAKIQGVLDRLEEELRPQRLRDVTEARLSFHVSQLRTSGLSENTITGHLAHLKAVLNWAVAQKLLPVRPALPKIQRGRKSNGRPMKGRPITAEEFDRMVAAVPKELGEEAAAPWQHYLRGMWASGLRLTESLDLWWDREDRLFPVFPRGGRPMLRIPAELEKGNADRLLPIAPEFALLLAETPEGARTGPVFKLDGRVGRLKPNEVSKIVASIGERAGVRVYVDPKDPDKVKYASAHDLRRAFGERWAARLMPPQLKELMRHESIETTLRFYVGTDAQRTADAAWAAFERTEGAFPDRFANTFANTAPKQPSGPKPRKGAKVPEKQADSASGAAGTRTQDLRIKSPLL